MRHIMIDLETLDTSPTAVVVSLGAVVFGPDTDPDVGNRFYVEFTGDLGTQTEKGRTINADTVMWWMTQPTMARLLFTSTDPERTEARRTTEQGLQEFAEFCGRNGGAGHTRIWGNGSDFDNVILSSLYQSFGIRRPWSFRHNRCYRTMCNQVPRHSIPFNRYGTEHNALDDAITQAQHLKKILTYLNIGNPE